MGILSLLMHRTPAAVVQQRGHALERPGVSTVSLVEGVEDEKISGVPAGVGAVLMKLGYYKSGMTVLTGAAVGGGSA